MRPTGEYDFIVVGAGSAGNVLAARLTKDAGITVLLLEASGPDYRMDFRTQMPAALAYPLQGRRCNWAYRTDPEPHMNHRRPYFRKAEVRDTGPNAYHGDAGPLSVVRSRPGKNPLFAAMVEAGVQAGYPRNDDLNGYRQEGFGPMDRTVTPAGAPARPGATSTPRANATP